MSISKTTNKVAKFTTAIYFIGTGFLWSYSYFIRTFNVALVWFSLIFILIGVGVLIEKPFAIKAAKTFLFLFALVFVLGLISPLSHVRVFGSMIIGKIIIFGLMVINIALLFGLNKK